MSSSIAASTVRRSARVPSRWPSATGSPRDIAQRPLPSRMIATQPTGSGGSSGARGLRNRSSRPTEASDFEDLLLRARGGQGGGPARLPPPGPAGAAAGEAAAELRGGAGGVLDGRLGWGGK